MQLPNADAAIVSREKVVDYLLNPRHPDSAGKAAFFLSMGCHVDRWKELADALKHLGKTGAVTVHVESEHGAKYIIEGTIDSPIGRTVSIRTVWIVDSGSQAPRLVTAYPIQQES